jgi:hypothetical protein
VTSQKQPAQANPPQVLLGSLRTQMRNIRAQFGNDGVPPETQRLVRTLELLDDALRNGEELPYQWRHPYGRCTIQDHARDELRWVQQLGRDMGSMRATLRRLQEDLESLASDAHAAPHPDSLLAEGTSAPDGALPEERSPAGPSQKQSTEIYDTAAACYAVMQDQYQRLQRWDNLTTPWGNLTAGQQSAWCQAVKRARLQITQQPLPSGPEDAIGRAADALMAARGLTSAASSRWALGVVRDALGQAVPEEDPSGYCTVNRQHRADECNGEHHAISDT